MNEHEASLFGTDLFGEPLRPEQGPLGRAFLYPPFSVWDASDGTWQERKRAWLALGIQSELGRGANLMDDSKSSVYNGRSDWSGYRGPAVGGKPENRAAPGGSAMPAANYSKTGARGDSHGRPITPGAASWLTGAPAKLERSASYGGTDPARVFGTAESADGSEVSQAIVAAGSGTSVFDPVVCELLYAWFAPPRGTVYDPFAGGSVRGIVASVMGRTYVGQDLSPAQCAANHAQADRICRPPLLMPTWVCGDSAAGAPERAADFVFSCPPYGDLERYSDDPRDLSAMPYADFIGQYLKVIKHAAGRLKNDRFAAWVVGDFRDGTSGALRGFVLDTVTCFQAAGLLLYNEAILVTARGSLPIRTSFYFRHGRKLGRTHQNVLIFVKGDPKKAEAAVMPQEEEAKP